MTRVSIMAALVAAAFAAGSLTSVEAMAQAKPAAKAAPAKATAAKPAAKAAPKASTVSGKVIAIDSPLQMVTLDNGKTYLIKDKKKFGAMKKGAKVKLSVAPAKA
jgi:hypothetical protein